MRLQSGSMVVDFYPTKSWLDDVINPDKFLKVLTFSGETMKKEVVTKDQMIDGINRRLARNYKVICNNTLPQYVSENVNNSTSWETVTQIPHSWGFFVIITLYTNHRH